MSLEDKLLKNTYKDSCFLTSSGSSAIILALLASEIPKGSEVLIPALCCPAVLFAVQIAGFKHKLVDVDKINFNISINNIEKAITSSTRALIAVHMYGIPCDLEKIKSISLKYNLILIEDSCLILPGQKNEYGILGKEADFSVISFGYDKPITINYGGALLTDSKISKNIVLKKLNENRFLQFQGQDSLKSEILSKLKKLPISNEKRIKNIRIIHSILDRRYLMNSEDLQNYPLWRYPILLQNIEQSKFKKNVEEHDLKVSYHYQSLSKFSSDISTPNAEYIAKYIINIFIHPNVNKRDIKLKISLLNKLSKS